MLWRSMTKLLACGVSLWLVSQIFAAASFSNFGALAGTAVIMWLLNLTVRPILKILTIPIGCLTLGLSYLLIDVFCIWLADRLIPGISLGGFLPMLTAALLASLISSVLKDGKHKK